MHFSLSQAFAELEDHLGTSHLTVLTSLCVATSFPCSSS